MEPANKIASDKEILDALSKFNGDRNLASDHLGMAKKTISNRLRLMKLKEPEEQRPSTYQHDSKVQRFFISSVVSGAPVSKKTYEAVQLICSDLNAKEIYIPVEYHWQDILSGREEPTYDSKIKDHLLSEDIHLNEHLSLMGSVPIHATIMNPLSGMKHTSKQKSAIYGHPQRAMESIATQKHKLPKLIYTTGAITEPRYTTSKAGRKAKDLHTRGGLIVEQKGGRFHVFEITINDDGSCYHLNKLYTNGVKISLDSLPAIYMADEHAEGYDKETGDATYWNDDSMVNELNPELVVRGDVYNHGSDSHHCRGNVAQRIIREQMGASLVKEELESCFDHIENTTVGSYKNLIVASNHHDHLKRWLNEFNPHTGDTRNVLLYHELNAEMVRELYKGDFSVDPFELYGRVWRKDAHETCTFLGRDDEYKVCGVDVSLHGDAAGNGARGGIEAFSVSGVPTVIGHGHSPKIRRNVHQVGCGASELGYNKGHSGWLASHCLIYPDGNKTMLHIIEGKWKL